MTRIGKAIPIPSLPKNAEFANYIYSHMDLEEKHQDLLTVVLPSGYTIEAGWFPECDPLGQFIVKACHGYGELASVCTESPYEAVQIASQLAWQFSAQSIAVSNSAQLSLVR